MFPCVVVLQRNQEQLNPRLQQQLQPKNWIIYSSSRNPNLRTLQRVRPSKWREEIFRKCLFPVLTSTSLSTEGTATFIAKVGGEPIPSVKWMKGKWRQLTHGGRISIVQKGQESKLEIREVTKSDSGQYRCVASNKHGEIECNADMHVDGKKEAPQLEGDLRAKLKK